MDRPPSDLELIKTALDWLIRNFRYREGRFREDQMKAAGWANTWVKTIKRCQENQGPELDQLLASYDVNDVNTSMVVEDLKELLDDDSLEEHVKFISSFIK